MWAGEGPYLDEMKRRMVGLPVFFPGYVEGEELVRLYSSCDAFVFPSTTDTFGNVVLESQACGTPVIATDQGGPMENVLSDETGYIVRGNDKAALIDAMARMAESGEQRRAMGRKAREYAETRSMDQAFRRLLGNLSQEHRGFAGA